MSHAIAYNSSCDVITAFCSDFRSGYEDYLHSFAYDSKTNKVLDYTLNIIMDKDDYFKLLNVRPIKVLKNSDLKKMSSFFERNSEIAQNITIKEYLVFPEAIDQYISDIKYR